MLAAVLVTAPAVTAFSGGPGGTVASGMTGPPVVTGTSGVILFITAGIAGARLQDVFREAAPFALALVAVLALVTYVPGLSLWLPDTLMGPTKRQ